MIQANEARVNNYYNRELRSSRGLTYDHEFKLTETEMGYLFSTDTSFALQDLFGIPLSSEILSKCGFKNQKYKEWEAFAYKDTPICSYYDGAEWCFKYGYDSDLTFAACEHLHQLQNLIFALTQTELSINL